MNFLDSKQVDALAHAGAVKTVELLGTDGGFLVKVNDSLLEAKRGHPRVFRKLQTAASFLKDKGIGDFHVDVKNWKPEQAALN